MVDRGQAAEVCCDDLPPSPSRFSGPTVHFVDEEFDTGPILAQHVVPVYPTDSYKTLAARVLKEVRGAGGGGGGGGAGHSAGGRALGIVCVWRSPPSSTQGASILLTRTHTRQVRGLPMPS